MKKYLQYNQTLYRETQQSDLSSAQKNLELAAGNAIRSPGALDLSGKQRTRTPGRVDKPQWTNEQDIALDLSGYTKQQDQNEALDLSKPAVSKPDHLSKVSYPQGPAQRVVSTPPSSRHSRSPAGQQYSLLQAALNSSLPNAGLQPFESVSQSNAGVHPAFETISQSTALLLQQRALNFTTAGLTVGDFSRAIKPFNTMSSRPLGFSMLQGPHAAGAVIQGVHKPIAITTPQPHNSSTDTKNQSVSISTVSVTDANHSVSSTTNQGFNVSQANYSTSGYHTQPNKSVNPRKLSGSDIKRQSIDSVKEHDGHVERYIIQPPDGLNHHFVNSNMHSLPTHTLPAFSCNQCPKTFKTKAALKLHTTVHKTSEERQYGCSICNRRFLHRHHLVVHQRKHSGEKPFKCNACSKTFMAIFLLHKHLRKHARETGPISQISVDQLKQLHDKKLISEGSEPLPFISPGPGQEKAPVIILDDDEGVNATVEIKINDVGKFDTNLDDKDKKILEILGNNQKLILDKLKADLLTKNKTKEIEPTLNTKNVNAKVSETNEKNVCDVELKAETEIQKPSVSECSGKTTTVMEETNDTKSDKDDDGEDYNYILKDSEDDSKDVSVSNDSNDQSNPSDPTESDLSVEQHKEEVQPDPIPEYGSDDEIELDCITGEIRVIGKKKVEEDIVVAMETESQANEQELKDIEIKEEDMKMNEKDTDIKENDMGMKENDMRKTDKIFELGIPEETVKEVVESLVKQTADSVNYAVVKVTDMSTDSDAVVVKKEKQHNATELVATDVKINQGDGISENIKMEVIEETVDVNQDCEGSADDVMKTEEKVMISSEKVMPASEKVIQSSEKAMPSSEKVMAASEKLMPASGNKNDEMIVEKNEDEVVKVKNVDKGETFMKESSTDKADLTKDEPEGSKPMVGESRNIFDKITQMKDMKDFKSCQADKEFVDKEVEIILRNIKRVVCKDESLTNVESKKPKLSRTSNEDNLENMPTLSAESAVKPTSMETESDTVSKSKHTTKGKKKSRKVKCEVCSRSFHSNHYLLLHMAVHKRGSMLQSLKKAKDYQLKAMGFVNKSNVTCEVCKKVFKFQRSLNSHMRVHSEKLIQTKLYRKSYRDFMAEAAPQNSRNSEKDKSQVVTVSDSIENESHLGHCSEGEQEKTSVPTISKSASARSSLDSVKASDVTEEVDDEPPIKVVIGSDNIKRYLCHACDNTYTTKQKLRMHALIHKDNCYLCDICGKSFFRQITLEKHITTHKLPRPHVCDICKKTFIHRSSLMRHKVAHEKAATPGLKQQVADRNFEMKMLDTYSMLKQERMQQKLQQMQQRNETPEQISLKTLNKYDVLDLSVKIKPEDSCLPPVLSPVIANFTNSTHSIPCNLSPPLITQEGRSSYDKTPEKLDSRLGESDHNMVVNQVMDQASVSHVGEKRKPRTDSTCSESDIVAVEGHKVVQKRVRKTRVYPTSCRVCKEVFPNVMLLKSHMAVHNTVETHLYECHICRHRFTQSCSLLRHLKTSCQENKMKCVPCGRTFHRRNTFEQHMRLHQIGPPNLDGSFYDKRPDEVAMHEERESDIENNNLSKIHKTVVTTQELHTNMPPQQPLTLKIIDVVSKSEANATEYNCDDSDDARTYLYSEGEVHSRYNSDFSDNDWSPPQSPKKITAPQDLSMSSASMTLNLLSAVCSDIRNAEKEKELKQQELEEKQKELETIEILANLKRGAMQKSMSPAPVLPLADRVNNPSTVPLSVYDSIVNSVSYHHSHSYPRDSNKSVANPRNQNPITSNTSISNSLKHVVTGSGYASSPSALVSPLPNNQYHQSVTYLSNKHRVSTVSESSVSRVGEQKIPTVVLEVAANAETLNKQPGPSHRTWSGRSASVPSLGEPVISKDGNLTPDVSQTKIAYPAIQERLSLLMKAQVSASLAGNTVTVHDSQNLPISCIPSLNAANFRPHVSPGRHFPSHTQTFTDSPQDLTMKKSPVMTPVSGSNQAKTTHQPLLSPVVSPNITNNATTSEPYLKPLSKEKQKQNHDIPRSNSSRSLPSDLSRSNQGQGEGQRKTESVPAPPPPPLVPMFHCELCSRVLYSKTDLHLHMMEHGRSAGALFKMLHNNKLLAAGKKPLSQDSPIDFTKPGPSSSGTSPADVKNPVPKTLDLPTKVADKSKESSTPPVSRPLSIEQLIQPASRSMSIESLIQPASRSLSMESLSSSVPRSLPDSPGSQLKSFMSSAPKISETLSPVTSSDFSDSHSLPSPSTPSAPGTPGTPTANLDMLRQELRLKIYARRRSQGLDDLKVEFKQPEPTEMTEAEKVKLLYRRECNRQAAQRSRMRKKDLVDSLLEKLSEMPNVNPKVQKTEKADP